MEGALFLVSTPIGNLADLGARAAEVLGEADVVYAEDTRRTGRLLAHLGLDVPLRSLHEHNEASRTDEVLAGVRQGRRVSLVTDAGTPTVSDPGRRVVAAAHAAGLPVVPIPGPSAVTAAIAASGLDGDRFLFLGFPPRGGGDRSAWLQAAASSAFTVVAFESPRRLSALLAELEGAGAGERRAAVCRELTKLHEEVVVARLAELRRRFDGAEVRGEVTLVLEGAPREEEVDGEAARRTARAMADGGRGARDIAGRLVEAHGMARNDAYRLALEAAEESAAS